jgi:hypothetical protein
VNNNNTTTDKKVNNNKVVKTVKTNSEYEKNLYIAFNFSF